MSLEKSEMHWYLIALIIGIIFFIAIVILLIVSFTGDGTFPTAITSIFKAGTSHHP